ncbi:lipoprotein [Spiroplasma endosymbiont of Polydrusus cervinus]|uniref:lipoprotein n=1 Tax=Spiroplasma endosymbiont of Polydrusus cervinus TaxID=3066287 RepID=UPI0030CD283F
MKKILSILSTITLSGTSTTSLVACNTPQYSEDELKKEKEKNNININGNILEWMAPQEKPFNEKDDKWYFAVWHSDKNTDWRIIKFKNNEMTIKIDNSNNRQLQKTDLGMGRDLYITNDSGFVKYVTHWRDDNGSYFKSVYRWNGTSELQTPEIDNNGNIKN